MKGKASWSARKVHCTWQAGHIQMLLKVSGQHITGDTVEALGNICCDTWLHGQMHGVAHADEHVHIQALTDTVPHHTHTQTHTKTRSWLWDGRGWLMKACVHYYNIVSVEVSSADHILGQMKYVTEWYIFTDCLCEALLARLSIHQLTKDVSGICTCSTSTCWVAAVCETQSQSIGSTAGQYGALQHYSIRGTKVRTQLKCHYITKPPSAAGAM